MVLRCQSLGHPKSTLPGAAMNQHPPAHAAFRDLATGGCPPLDDLLLALAAEFGVADAAGTRARLDGYARELFGFAGLDAYGRAVRLAAVVDLELGLRPESGSADAFLLPRVLTRRRGHPVLLAAVAVE